MNQKGIFNPLIILIAAGVVVAVIFVIPQLMSTETPTEPSYSPSVGVFQKLSDDPKYDLVQEKYNLTEEQLEILSRVNQEDNSL